MMDEKLYREYMAGFEITQAAVVNKEKMMFVVQKMIAADEVDVTADQVPTRVISYGPSAFPATGGYARLEWAYGLKHLYPVLAPGSILVDGNFRVRESKTDNRFHEICPGEGDAFFSSPFITGCSGVRRIGNDVFAFGTQRKVFRRRGFRDWIDLTAQKEHDWLYQDILEWEEKRKKKGKRFWPAIGFEALDGFAVDDIYAGGGGGDLWHYDGKSWHEVDIPTNVDINAITCGGDGLVYVCCGFHLIFKGRGDIWESFKEERDDGYGYAVDINSSAWFDGRLYVATDMGLYFVEDDELFEYRFPQDGPQQYSFRHVVASEDCLVSYGLYQALAFDGRTWTTIIDSPVFLPDP